MLDELNTALDALEGELSQSWAAGDQVLSALKKIREQLEAESRIFDSREVALRQEIGALLEREKAAHTRADEAQLQSAELISKVAALQEQMAALVPADQQKTLETEVSDAAAAAKAQLEKALADKQAEIDKMSAALHALADQHSTERIEMLSKLEDFMARIEGVVSKNKAEQADLIAAAKPVNETAVTDPVDAEI